MQEQHYDPFGLLLAGIEKEGDPQHAYLYNQSSEKQPDVLGEGYAFETPLRNYDPQLGRFHGVDILAQEFASLSPYQYGFNNPVLYSDPSGAKPVAIEDAERAYREEQGSGGGGGNYNDFADLMGRPDMSWDQGLPIRAMGMPVYSQKPTDNTAGIPIGVLVYMAGDMSQYKDGETSLMKLIEGYWLREAVVYSNGQGSYWGEPYDDKNWLKDRIIINETRRLSQEWLNERPKFISGSPELLGFFTVGGVGKVALDANTLIYWNESGFRLNSR